MATSFWKCVYQWLGNFIWSIDCDTRVIYIIHNLLHFPEGENAKNPREKYVHKTTRLNTCRCIENFGAFDESKVFIQVKYNK